MIIQFKTDNAAFEDRRDAEFGFVLNQVSTGVARNLTEGKLRDTNGNTIGSWSTQPLRVITASYEHKYGMDMRAFMDRSGADMWRQEIAEEWWEQEMPEGTEKPSDPKAAADAYWDYVGEGSYAGEYFTIEETEVE